MSYAYRVISIDGGGVRGIIPARILKELEVRAGVPLASLFDLGVGTSTGALLLSAMSMPDENGSKLSSPDKMVDLYLRRAKSIFGVSLLRKILSLNGLLMPKINRKSFDKILSELFKNKRIAECAFPISITAYSIDSCRPQIWSTLEARRNNKNNHYLKDILGASCASPTYFAPKRMKMDDNKIHYFIDGVVFQNNPQIIPLLEISKIDPDIKSSDILMISIGTGISLLPVSGEKLMNGGVLRWIKKGVLVDVIIDAASNFSDIEGALLYPNRYRLQVEIPPEYSTVDNPANAKPLLKLTEKWIRDNSDMLDEIVKHLTLSKES